MAIIDVKINMEDLDTAFLKKQIKVLREVTLQQSEIERCHTDKIDALIGLRHMCENILEQCGETPQNVSVEFFAS